MQSLFDFQPAKPEPVNTDPLLGQYFTPEWAAQLLVERYFGELSTRDLVVEPSCGLGAFIKAIPADVPVIGVEVDPTIAEMARRNTVRKIITGDFATVPLPDGVTTIVGNPPFEMETVERFLTRAQGILPHEGLCGMIMPAYHFQTYGRVLRWNQEWSLQVDMIPRRLFEGLIQPLAFCMFRKDRERRMVGLALYAECEAIGNLTKSAQEVLKAGKPRTGVWRALVEQTLEQLGGRGTLEQIYGRIEPKRPTRTAFWREKVRQQLQVHFQRVGPGEYALA